jgi:hypothetical protein
MTAGVIFYLIYALFFKHAIVDFPIYIRYLCRGISVDRNIFLLHIVLHILGTALVFFLIGAPVWMIIAMATVDGLSHSFIDMLTGYFDIRCKNEEAFKEKFYWVPEVDQFLHCLVYITMVLGAVLIGF